MQVTSSGAQITQRSKGSLRHFGQSDCYGDQTLIDKRCLTQIQAATKVSLRHWTRLMHLPRFQNLLHLAQTVY